jgi:hypothetical protein
LLLQHGSRPTKYNTPYRVARAHAVAAVPHSCHVSFKTALQRRALCERGSGSIMQVAGVEATRAHTATLCTLGAASGDGRALVLGQHVYPLHAALTRHPDAAASPLRCE